MSLYCGHISIDGGKITIDLGGSILPDGVYSIIRESTLKKKEKCKSNPTHKPYDREEFKRSVIKMLAGRKISMPAAAKEFGLASSTFIARVNRVGIEDLFKRQGSAK